MCDILYTNMGRSDHSGFIKRGKRAKEIEGTAIRRDREILIKMGIIDKDGKYLKSRRQQREWK